MAPNDSTDDTQSDSQTNDAALSRRGLMAAGSLAGLGLAGAGLASADDQGSGSGDADTVDGHHANEFLHVDGSVNATADLNLGGNHLRGVQQIIPSVMDSRHYTMDHDDATVGWRDVPSGNEDILIGNAKGNIEAYYPFRAKQVSETRVVGPGASEFDTIEAAINDLPADNTPHGLPMGHVHVVPSWDSTQETTWPIEIRGNIAVTGGGMRKGTEIRPPNGEWAFAIDASDDWTINGYRTNKESVYLKGFDIRPRSDGDSTTNPKGGIRVDGGIEHVIEDINIRDVNDKGIFFTGEEHTYNNETKSIQSFSVVVRDTTIRGDQTYGIRSDPSYESNDLVFHNVKVKYSDKDCFSFKGGGAAIHLNGCTAEDYGRNGLRVEGVRSVHWSGGYMENSEDNTTNAIVFADYVWGDETQDEYVNSSGSIRDTYINGASVCAVTNGCNSLHVSDINYYDVQDYVAVAVQSEDNLYISPSTIVEGIAGSSGVPVYKDQHPEKIRIDGTRAWHNLSSSGVTGNYRGDSAYHNGADGNEQGLYVWNGSNWVGPNSSTI